MIDPGPKRSSERRVTMISPSSGRCLSVPYLWQTRMWDSNHDADDMNDDALMMHDSNGLQVGAMTRMFRSDD